MNILKLVSVFNLLPAVALEELLGLFGIQAVPPVTPVSVASTLINAGKAYGEVAEMLRLLNQVVAAKEVEALVVAAKGLLIDLKYDPRIMAIYKKHGPEAEDLKAVVQTAVRHGVPTRNCKTLSSAIEFLVDERPDITVAEFSMLVAQRHGCNALATDLSALHRC